MKLITLKPRNFINPLLSRKSVDEKSFNKFKLNFKLYQDALDTQLKGGQTEPNIVTNVLKPFVDSLGYKSENYSQKGQISIDLAVMQGNLPTVIFEVKRPNSNDMIAEGGINKKAFQQAIYYFMNERAKNNKTLFHIVITDFFNWFVFDAKDFDRLFWRNPRIKKIYEAHTSQSTLGDNTAEFYKDLELEIPNLKKNLMELEEIECAHFNIKAKANDKELTAIYKLLSPDCLTKLFNPNDANSLNKEFYNELLYILGLEEAKKEGKKIIGRSTKPQNGSLYENIANKLSIYSRGKEPAFEDVIKLIIIWVNRILFLKLLESQIVKWTNDKNTKFLVSSKISEYDDLETLFFEVLAKPIESRKFNEFNHIPYLNSSLFELHPEEQSVKISNLTDGLSVDYYVRTVVKNENNQRKTGSVNLLTYLLDFLDAYNFANDNDAELSNSSKTLISASVLGLIFEKINGYKDGSFYTPSFITMYMARETIEKSIIDKFNQVKGWDCRTLADVYNKDPSIVEANSIINDIKICDPAVGSGHFLVSALNELIRIKSRLRVLVDESGDRIKHSIQIENDELIIISDEGEEFEYKKGSVEKTRIQKTLFKEKQSLIENCLFGVDINPNSVNICRLRLWIELLKNSYYKEDGQLDTLPNIDINIKCGNSLISRYGLKDELNNKNIQSEIQNYKAQVKNYKENIGSKHAVMQSIISIKQKFEVSLKEKNEKTQYFQKSLREYVQTYDFDGLSKELAFIAFNLKVPRATIGMFANIVDEKVKNKKLQQVVNAFQKLEEIESGKIYQSAFEWRIEFPEVLNAEGDFVGFDVIIGNPPYIKEDKNKAAFDGLHEKPCYQGKTDLWHLFTDQAIQIVKTNGLVSFIAKNQWLESQSASNMRKIIYAESEILNIIDFGINMVFDEANQQTMVFLIKKTIENTDHNIFYKKITSSLDNGDISKLMMSDVSDENIKVIQKLIPKKYDELANLTFSDSGDEEILIKIEALKNFDFNEAEDIAQGIIGGPDDAFIIEEEDVIKFTDQEKSFIKMIHTNTERWTTSKTKQYILYTSAKNFSDKVISDYPNIEAFFEPNKNKLVDAKNRYGTPNKPYFYLHRERDERFFVGGERLVFASRTYECNFTVTSEPLYGTRNLFFVKSDQVNLKYIAALLNSKLMFFYMHQRLKHTGDLLQIDKNQFIKIPFYIPSKEVQKEFAIKVQAIIDAKESNQDFNLLEVELNQMVYKLYNLSENEIIRIDQQ